MTVQVADYHVGLRADTDEILNALRSVFGRWLVDTDAVPDDFGISANRRGGSGPRLLPELLHGRLSMLRSRSVPRLLRRLDSALGALERPVGDGFVRVPRLAAVIRDGGAALVPSSLVVRSTAVERAVAASGGTIAEAVVTFLDLAALEIVVAPGLAGPVDVPELQDDFTAAPGRYPIRSVFWASDQVVEDERPATGVARMAQLIDKTPELDRARMLKGLAELSPLFVSTPIPATGADLSAVLATLA